MREYKKLNLKSGQADIDMTSTTTKMGVRLKMVMRDSRWKMIAYNSRNGLSKTIDAGLRDTPDQINTMVTSMVTACRQYGVEWLDDTSAMPARAIA